MWSSAAGTTEMEAIAEIAPAWALTRATVGIVPAAKSPDASTDPPPDVMLQENVIP